MRLTWHEASPCRRRDMYSIVFSAYTSANRRLDFTTTPAFLRVLRRGWLPTAHKRSGNGASVGQAKLCAPTAAVHPRGSAEPRCRRPRRASRTIAYAKAGQMQLNGPLGRMALGWGRAGGSRGGEGGKAAGSAAWGIHTSACARIRRCQRVSRTRASSACITRARQTLPSRRGFCGRATRICLVGRLSWKWTGHEGAGGGGGDKLVLVGLARSAAWLTQHGSIRLPSTPLALPPPPVCPFLCSFLQSNNLKSKGPMGVFATYLSYACPRDRRGHVLSAVDGQPSWQELLAACRDGGRLQCGTER